VSERRERAAAASTRDADASPVLVWNGLVTKMRRVGAEEAGKEAGADADRSLEPEPRANADSEGRAIPT
jgi:hypothetical protein